MKTTSVALLEENEKRVRELSAAIQEGEDSGRYENFDPVKHLKFK